MQDLDEKIVEKYKEKFDKLAIEFAKETGADITDISFNVQPLYSIIEGKAYPQRIPPFGIRSVKFTYRWTETYEDHRLVMQERPRIL